MDLLIIMTYAAFAYGCFKLFNIPVNKWTVPTAILGGVFIVAGLILTMNYNHPYTFMAQKGRCSLYVLGAIYTCSKFAGLRCPLWIPTVFLSCFAPLPN
jgi:hypothetical protein